MSASNVMMAYSKVCRDLSAKELERLVTLGVPSDAMGFDADESHFKLRAASVFWEGPWFQIDKEGKGGERCVVIVCRDEHGEVADLAAWSPRDDRVGSWIGRVAMIGEERCTAPRLSGELLWVREGVLDWLVHRRTGVVILNAELARPILAAASPVAVKTKAHRDLLQEKWRAPQVKIIEAGVAESILGAA